MRGEGRSGGGAASVTRIHTSTLVQSLRLLFYWISSAIKQ